MGQIRDRMGITQGSHGERVGSPRGLYRVGVEEAQRGHMGITPGSCGGCKGHLEVIMGWEYKGH